MASPTRGIPVEMGGDWASTGRHQLSRELRRKRAPHSPECRIQPPVADVIVASIHWRKLGATRIRDEETCFWPHPTDRATAIAVVGMAHSSHHVRPQRFPAIVLVLYGLRPTS